MALPVAEGEEARAGLEERRVGVLVTRCEAAAVELERDAGRDEDAAMRRTVLREKVSGEDGDGVAERGSAGAEGGEVEGELLGEEWVGEGHTGRLHGAPARGFAWRQGDAKWRQRSATQ
jgi:hypothetical protein